MPKVRVEDQSHEKKNENKDYSLQTISLTDIVPDTKVKYVQ